MWGTKVQQGFGFRFLLYKAAFPALGVAQIAALVGSLNPAMSYAVHQQRTRAYRASNLRA